MMLTDSRTPVVRAFVTVGAHVVMHEIKKKIKKNNHHKTAAREYSHNATTVTGITQTKSTTAKTLFSQRANRLKFHCSVLGISLAEVKMLDYCFCSAL